MVLELHILPPAFSLPSIDAHCIAAVAYFSQALPRDEWRLIATTPNNNPTGELPALRNGAIWIGGWANIVDYIRKLNPEWDLDATAEVEGMERGDVIAFSTFIQSRGQDLLDLSLYLSSTNYSTLTRPTFSSFLPFPLSWILPHSLRAGAKARTAHLGLSALDIDSDTPPSDDKNPVPESLRHASPPSILASPESAAQIRLHALAKSFLQPLQELRGQSRFFVGDKPTTLDCLATGYLLLMLLPDLPAPWLATAIRTEFPQLGAFVHDMQDFFFGGAVSLADAHISLSPSPDVAEGGRVLGTSTLPWHAPPSGSLLDIARAVGGHVADNIPIISDVLKARRIQADLEDAAEADPERTEELALEHHRASMFKREILMSVGSVALGVGLFVAFVVRQGVLGGVMRGVQARVAAREKEGEEEGFSWETNNGQEGEVTGGLANLASQMDFLGDMQFGAPVAEVGAETGGGGDE